MFRVVIQGRRKYNMHAFIGLIVIAAHLGTDFQDRGFDRQYIREYGVEKNRRCSACSARALFCELHWTESQQLIDLTARRSRYQTCMSATLNAGLRLRADKLIRLLTRMQREIGLVCFVGFEVCIHHEVFRRVIHSGSDTEDVGAFHFDPVGAAVEPDGDFVIASVGVDAINRPDSAERQRIPKQKCDQVFHCVFLPFCSAGARNV